MHFVGILFLFVFAKPANINFISHFRVGFLQCFALSVLNNLFRSKMPFPDMHMFVFPVPGSEFEISANRRFVFLILKCVLSKKLFSEEVNTCDGNVYMLV